MMVGDGGDSMLNKVGGNLQACKATVNPHLSAPPAPPSCPSAFSQQTLIEFHSVQIRMSGDNVFWDNFILRKNEASSTNKGRD